MSVPASTAARKPASPGSRRVVVVSTTRVAVSVLPRTAPMPGKCLTAVAMPAWRMPVVKASTFCATADGEDLVDFLGGIAVSSLGYGNREVADALDIGFNSRYLLDIAAQIEGEVAVLKLADPGSPTLVQDKENKGALYVLMPMRV